MVLTSSASVWNRRKVGCQGNGPVSKVLAVQVWRPKFRSQKPSKKQLCLVGASLGLSSHPVHSSQTAPGSVRDPDSNHRVESSKAAHTYPSQVWMLKKTALSLEFNTIYLWPPHKSEHPKQQDQQLGSCETKQENRYDNLNMDPGRVILSLPSKPLLYSFCQCYKLKDLRINSIAEPSGTSWDQPNDLYHVLCCFILTNPVSISKDKASETKQCIKIWYVSYEKLLEVSTTASLSAIKSYLHYYIKQIPPLERKIWGYTRCPFSKN